MLPRGWAEAPLLDIVDLHDARRIPLNQAERAAKPGKYPYYGANGQVDTVGDYLFDGDYILLAEDGGYFDDPERHVAYNVEGRFWVNNHAHILKCKEGIPQSFLTRLLNSLDWMPFVNGTTRLKLTQGGMQRITVPLPPLPEQHRIIAKLDALIARIARARSELDRVPTMANALRSKVLHLAFAPVSGENWPTTAFGDVIQEGLIGLVRSKEEQAASGSPYIRMNHYDLDGTWNDDKLTFVSCTRDEQKRFELRADDILFNTRNSAELVGKVAIWPVDKKGFVYNNNLLRLRMNNLVLPRFVFHYMTSPKFRMQLEGHKSATTSVAAIYQRSLYKLPVPVPSLAVQQAAIDTIDAAFARAARFEAEAARARALIDRLETAFLAKAFRGELVPQDPKDEPASVLLERIRVERATTSKPKRKQSSRGSTN